MDVTIRKAALKDMGAIQDLNHELFLDEQRRYKGTLRTGWPYSKEGRKYFLKALKGPKDLLLIAELDGKTVGYIAGSIGKAKSWRTMKKMGELDNMIILKGYRRRGVGTALVKELFRWFRKKGIRNATVVASYANVKALDFYRKHGFRDMEVVLEKRV